VVPSTVPGSREVYSYAAHVRPCLQPAKAGYTLRLHM